MDEQSLFAEHSSPENSSPGNSLPDNSSPEDPSIEIVFSGGRRFFAGVFFARIILR
jgi:hypothetical protein